MTLPIHFAHANGFPAPVYRKLFSALEQQGFSVGWLEKHGHDPLFPVTDSWPHLVDELLEAIRCQHKEPVLAVGHSLGGVLSLFASWQAPELFRGVIMLDAPLLTPLEGGLVRLIKRLGAVDRITPAGRTLGRRSVWCSRKEAIEYFQKKPLFRHFDPECLADYVDHGMEHGEAEVRLGFDPDIEISIYRSIPDRWPRAVKSFPVPTVVVYGDRSDVVMPHMIMAMRLRRHVRVQKVPGGHMFPLEQPEQTAQLITRLAESMGVSKPS
ncbi:alpha/beta hydrolase [Kistimonas scapharcae]|uniref:Alpha/beta hydrolase n=1 Tax=Kistimonas scapharcae TaxID=1036133 RepID=A0ABP8UYL3_9GAMM